MNDDYKGIGSLFGKPADSTIAKPVVQAATDQEYLSDLLINTAPLNLTEFKVKPVKRETISPTLFQDTLKKSGYGKVKMLPSEKREAVLKKQAADAFIKERDRPITSKDWAADNVKWKTHIADSIAENEQKYFYNPVRGAFEDKMSGVPAKSDEVLKEQQKLSKIYKDYGGDEKLSKFKSDFNRGKINAAKEFYKK